jgi:hypothetical protein
MKNKLYKKRKKDYSTQEKIEIIYRNCIKQINSSLHDCKIIEKMNKENNIKYFDFYD